MNAKPANMAQLNTDGAGDPEEINLEPDAEIDFDEHDQGSEEGELTAQEYHQQIAESVRDKDIRACFDALDDIEEQRANLTEKKKSIVQQLVDKGCHRQGVISAWQRHSKPKKQQAKIDATFKVCCEQLGGQEDLFGAGPAD